MEERSIISSENWHLYVLDSIILAQIYKKPTKKRTKNGKYANLCII